MKARIYKPGKTAMQSGRGKLDCWTLEYESSTAKAPESLMGWTAAGDTLGQVRLHFPTQSEAEAYARKRELAYTVQPPHERRVKPRNYVDNFRYDPADEE